MEKKQTKKLNKKKPQKIKISALQKTVNEAIRKKNGDGLVSYDMEHKNIKKSVFFYFFYRFYLT